MKDLVSEYLDRSKLPSEVDLLKDIIGVLSQAFLKLMEENAALKAENEMLRSDMALLKHKIFGRGKGQGKTQGGTQDNTQDQTQEEGSSLRLITGRGKGKDALPSGNQNQRKNHPGRSPLSPDLPRERIVYDIETSQKICPKCQGFLSPIGEEISEQLEWVRPFLKVLEQVRLKYACRKCSQTIVTAPTPYKPIEKGLAGPNLIAHVVVSKFCNHLPLYRQEQIFKRYGVSLKRSTLCRWTQSIARALKPLYELMREELIKGDHIFADETPLITLNVPSGEGTGSCLGYVWAYGREGSHGRLPLVVYDFSLGRSGSYAREFLKGFKGTLQTDAYGGYDRLFVAQEKGGQGCIPAGCWAHVYRKFVDALVSHPTSPAQEMMALIADLYALERDAKKQSLTAEAVQKMRETRARPLLTEINRWLQEYQPKVVPKSLLGRAIAYTLNNWDSLITYVTDGRLNIDNNYSERNIKLAVMGRKNYLFAGSEGGGESIAILYSFIQTCLLNGIDPEAYLADVMVKIQYHPNARARELLPHHWKPPNNQAQAGQTQAA